MCRRGNWSGCRGRAPFAESMGAGVECELSVRFSLAASVASIAGKYEQLPAKQVAFVKALKDRCNSLLPPERGYSCPRQASRRIRTHCLPSRLGGLPWLRTASCPPDRANLNGTRPFEGEGEGACAWGNTPTKPIRVPDPEMPKN